MAEAQRRFLPAGFYDRVITPVLGSMIIFSSWYFLVGLLHYIEPLKRFAGTIWFVQIGGGVLLLLAIIVGLVSQYREEAKAKEASAKVNAAFDKKLKEAAGKNVSEISPEEVAASITDAKVSGEQLARLAEQRKQHLLIDDEYFRLELSSLIVDYLQPLPRNAKRVLNRFRVNLLIAHRRGLFTSEPKVTAQQIGKWLVLMERWPQLGRSLTIAPERMEALESNGANQNQDLIKTMAPSYAGDEALQKFLQSKPPLATAVPRLVHYGTAPTSSV